MILVELNSVSIQFDTIAIQFDRPRRRLEDDIKVDIERLGFEVRN
jgi:hypothetical protein